MWLCWNPDCNDNTACNKTKNKPEKHIYTATWDARERFWHTADYKTIDEAVQHLMRVKARVEHVCNSVDKANNATPLEAAMLRVQE